MCGPNDECPPGMSCSGGVCRTGNGGGDGGTKFPLTITLGGNAMGTVTSSPAGIDCGTDCSESFASGTMVTLTATPASGSTFVGWSGACSGTGACTITIAAAVNITANFATDNSLVVTRAGNGDGIVSSNPAGISCGTSCSYQFPQNTMVTLTALPATGSTFQGWSGAGCTGTGTCMVTTDAAKMVTATFSLTQSALTVTLAGTGSGTVMSTPAGIDCGSDCTEAYNYNQMVTLTAAPATGSTFTSWSGGACNGSTNATCTVTITQATSVTANFTLTQFLLTVTPAGGGTGTVSSTPAGINCGADCTENYDYNQMVTLSATPGAGSTFAGWSGGGCTGTASCTVTMTVATTVTASFTLNNYTLTVAKSGTGSGLVTSNLGGISCGMSCAQSYPYNTMVTLTATASTGSTFAGWSGGGCTGTGTCTVTVAAATTVNAAFSQDQHTLTVTKNGNGSGTVSGLGIACGADCTETVDYNTQITLSATPQAGSVFDGWTGGGCTGTGTCQVTITQATMVTATFTLTQHLLTVAKAGTGAGTVTSAPTGISCGTDCNEIYDYNTPVTLTAAPQAGSTFGGWSGGGCSGTTLTCMTTVTGAATVTATFTLTNQTLTVTKAGAGTGTVTSNIGTINCGATCTSSYPYNTQVTLSAVPDTGMSFTGWSGGGCTGNGTCTVTLTAATTVTATFAATTQALSVTKSGTGAGTVTSNVGGINCGATCSANIAFGTSVTLTAAASAGSTFTSWSGGACNGSTNTTCTFTLSSSTTVNANFAIQSFALNVNKAGTGTGTVTSTDTPQGINCGADCNQTYNYGTSITLIATSSPNSVFMGWSGGGCTGTGNCTVTVNAATTVAATFDLVQHTLTVKPGGTGTGTVASNPAGINCGADCDELYNDGQMVTLVATPSTGNTFVGWSGDCTGTSTTCTLTMNGDKVAYPDFAPQKFLLTVSTNPAGTGDVISTSDTGINCGADCTEQYDYNTVVSLKASEHAGYTFTGWSGACTGNGNCDVTMDMAKTVTANFVVTTYTLTVNLGGTGGGTVASTPAGINCGADCSEVYNDGQMIQLTPTANTGSNFTSWSGCTSVTGTTCNVTMNASKSVTANFTIQQFAVNLTKAGTGTGTVTSTPSGMNCGPTCTSASTAFNYNTMVTLSASPAVGSTFAGWSGACTGTGSCGPLTMTAAKNVTATFNSIPPNYVFVTSTAQNANLGGLAGADMICQQRANAAGLAGTYKAWLSTSTVNAINRFGSARGWIRKDGKPFVDQLSDITTGHVLYPARLDELGNDVTSASVYTGSNNIGTLGVWGSCSDWTSASGSTFVSYGYANATSYQVSFGGATDCSQSLRLLCLGIDRQAVVTVPTVNARRAFTTEAGWTPGGGLTSADSLCQSEANTAALSGTYKALLPTSTASAISRFSTAAPALPWARPDNVLLAPSAAALATATTTYLDAAPNNNAANTSWAAANGVWGGGVMNLTQVSTMADTCNDWTSGLSTVNGRGGQAGFTFIEWLMRGFGSTTACNATNMHLVCLQQ